MDVVYGTRGLKSVFHLDTTIYDKHSAEKLEAAWKDEKTEYEEIIIAPSNSSGNYWQIIENTKMKQKGIIRGIPYHCQGRQLGLTTGSPNGARLQGEASRQGFEARYRGMASRQGFELRNYRVCESHRSYIYS